MATKTRNLSLTAEMDSLIEQRVRSGLYGNASDVVRASLRALLREEQGAAWREWLEISRTLPQAPLTPAIEQDIERRVRAGRARDRRKARA